MSSDPIRESVESVTRYYAEHPEKALTTDKAAVAVVEAGLRCRVEGPNGAVLVSDMPKGIGGGAKAPTPGWLMRAALAACDATVIAMRAAQLGVALTRLEVTVESRSDNRGMIAEAADVPPGPLDVSIRVRIAADGASPEELRRIVEWAEAHSPVGDALRRAVPTRLEIEFA